MADRDGVSIYVGTYSSEADARGPRGGHGLRESGEVGYYGPPSPTSPCTRLPPTWPISAARSTAQRDRARI